MQQPIPIKSRPNPVPLASPDPTGLPPDEEALQPQTPVEAGLRLITYHLGVPAALLFTADAAGALHLASAVGSWGDDPSTIQGLVDRLGGGGVDVLDVAGTIEGVRFVAGARLGDGDGALLVVGSEAHDPSEAWTEAFATASQLALGLVRSLPGALDLGRLLHEVAVHPGTFEDRLGLALQQATEMLGLDGAAFVHIDRGLWMPQTVYDPSERLVPVRPIALGETFCAITVQTDGPFGVEDAAASPAGPASPGAYIGAPVFVQGRCVGTFCVVGHGPRARPFSDADRALVESLARWMGASVQGSTTARELADREADLAGFFDGAPMGMGIVRLLDGDLEFVRVNATAATALGATPEAIAGQRATDLGLGGRIGRQWLAACRRALEDGTAQRFDVDAGTPDRPRRMATTVSRIDADDEVPRFAFIVEDRSLRGLEGGPSPVEALLAHAPLALFAADPAGRLVMSGGRGLDLLGLSLDTSRGRLLGDLFASAPKAATGIADALAGHDAAWLVEVGDRAFEIRVQGRADRAGQPAGLIGVALDVTGHHASTSRIAEAEARKALLKHLDHEIRSPLTSILGYADLLEEHPSPEDLAEVRGVIGRAGERLMAALDEMALLGGEAAASPPEPTDPCAVLMTAAEGSRTAAEARRLSLNLWCSLPDEPLLMDAALFERLLRTLISGAVATAQGACVDVRMKASGPVGMEIVVTGGTPGTLFGLREAYVPRLAEALGGSARYLDGDPPGWSLRLPRQQVPVVDLPEVDHPARAVGWADGGTGEAPAMVFPVEAS